MESCFEGHVEEVADFENCVAACSGSSSGKSSEGGTEGYSEVAAAADFGRSAAVHFADVHAACKVSCSLTFAELNSEMLPHAMVVHSGEEVQGSEPFAEDCSVYAEGGWVEWDQWSHYLC